MTEFEMLDSQMSLNLEFGCRSPHEGWSPYLLAGKLLVVTRSASPTFRDN